MNRIIILLLLFCAICIHAQNNRGDIRIMFYNAENLFDTQNDPNTNDDEFTPDGSRHWTEQKYYSKLNNIFKVVVNIGVWSPPEIIGLCEIENKQVLSDLIFKTPLYKYDYEIIHYDSPDGRGIDVGCLYNKKELKLISSCPVTVFDDEDNDFKTRDILYAEFITKNYDTLHLFINHWPSRRGGQQQSEKRRILASEMLSNFINFKFSNSNPYIIILGDFNDEPHDKSLSLLTKEYNNYTLVNLSLNHKSNFGTLKYNGNWNLFDQVIVSSALLNKNNRLWVSNDSYNIFNIDYLLMEDKSYSGKKPFNTYNGYNYQNGFSDHLPVFADIWIK